MLHNPGWKRVWLVVAIGLSIVMLLSALANSNVKMATGSSWYCFPGTMTLSSFQVDAGFREPNATEVAQQAARIVKMNPGMDKDSAELTARLGLGERLYETIPSFSCTSYGHVLLSLFSAAVMALLIALAFKTLRWVSDGFRRS